MSRDIKRRDEIQQPSGDFIEQHVLDLVMTSDPTSAGLMNSVGMLDKVVQEQLSIMSALAAEFAAIMAMNVQRAGPQDSTDLTRAPYFSVPSDENWRID